ncbi:MAG: hypothetical protein ALAOOOJD_00004 [bacterium]|nr:hypothetical protein [bacterium]
MPLKITRNEKGTATKVFFAAVAISLQDGGMNDVENFACRILG